MLYKKIAKRAKESHRLGVAPAVVDDVPHQWLYAGNGYYDCTELPKMTFGQACSMFDFSEKVQEKLLNCDEHIADCMELVDEALGTEIHDELVSIRTYLGDDEVKLLISRNDPAVFAIISANDLSPITETVYTRYVLAKSESGYVFVLIYEGLLLIAVIRRGVLTEQGIKRWSEDTALIEKCFDKVIRDVENAKNSKAGDDDSE